MSETRAEYDRAIEPYLIAGLIGFLVVGSSLLFTFIIAFSGVDKLTAVLGAWAIGALTQKYYIPWAKQGVPAGGEDSD